MIKKISTIFICILLAAVMQMTVYASFYETGGYSRGNRIDFCFETNDAVLIYNDEYYYYPYDNDGIWAGSKMYIPIYSDTNDEIATMDEITQGKVGISYKASRFVDSVKIVDGATANSEGVEPGAHACITFTNEYTDVDSPNFNVQLVLVIDGTADQNTLTIFRDNMKTRVEDLHRGSVYAVYSPTVFRTDNFGGEVTFDFGDDVRYTTTVRKNARYYLNLDRSEITALKDMYPKIYMETYSFPGDYDTFERSGALEIPIDRDAFKPKRNANTQVFAYQYSDGILTALDANALSFDAKKDVLTIKTLTLGTYVLSAQALLKTVDESADDIIQTGYAKDANEEPPMESSVAPVPQQTLPATNADNPVTGGDTIYAVNTGAQNPNTSDGRVLWPAVMLCAASAAVLAAVRKKA